MVTVGKWVLAACGTALMVNLSFSPFLLGFLGFFCLLPLMIGDRWRGRRRFLLGWSAGFLTQLLGYYWIFITIRDFGGQGVWVSAIGAVLFCLYQGLDMALWLLVAPGMFRKARPFLAALGYGGTWYLIQILLFPYVFPWSLGATQTWSAALMKTSMVWSQSGIGFFLVSIQVLGYFLWREKAVTKKNVLLTGALVAVFISPMMLPTAPVGRHLRVAVIQPNLIPWAKQNLMSPEELFNAHAQPTRSLLGSEGADLVLWPEAALALPLNLYPEVASKVHRLAREVGATILTGTLSVSQDRRWSNDIWMFRPDRLEPQKYAKQRLVLFSERLPWLLHWARYFDSALGGYVPGKTNRTFDYDGIQLVPLICFEAVLPDYARKRSGHLFINLTNDAWFGKTKASSLHLQHLQMRAVECQMPLVRATNSGISCWIDTRGRIHQASGVYTADARVYDVAIPNQPSIRINRYGDGLIAIGSILLAGWGILRNTRKSRLRATNDE